MPALNEQTGFLILAAGLAVVALGYLWLVVRAFRTHVGWGIASILLPPFGGLLFALVHFGKGVAPLGVMVLGGLIAASPIAVNVLTGGKIDDRAKVEVKKTDEEGQAEERITLTGANPAEYAVLGERKSFAVIQWANKDVTDEQVEVLRGMANLRELDLNSAAITDKSLEVIATLPKLESLRIACPAITDEGFRKYVMPLENLKELDLTGTKVKRATATEWMKAKEGRKRPSL